MDDMRRKKSSSASTSALWRFHVALALQSRTIREEGGDGESDGVDLAGGLWHCDDNLANVFSHLSEAECLWDFVSRERVDGSDGFGVFLNGELKKLFTQAVILIKLVRFQEVNQCERVRLKVKNLI